MVKYVPDYMNPDLLTKKNVKLVSAVPLNCFGDSTILSKMRLHVLSADESLVELLGPVAECVPEKFKHIDESIKHF